MKNLLLRIGLITRNHDGTIRYPFRIGPWWMWKWFLTKPVSYIKWCHSPAHGGCIALFRNLPGVIKWRKGRLLPVRWGISILSLIEIGDRG